MKAKGKTKIANPFVGKGRRNRAALVQVTFYHPFTVKKIAKSRIRKRDRADFKLTWSGILNLAIIRSGRAPPSYKKKPSVVGYPPLGPLNNLVMAGLKQRFLDTAASFRYGSHLRAGLNDRKMFYCKICKARHSAKSTGRACMEDGAWLDSFFHEGAPDISPDLVVEIRKHRRSVLADGHKLDYMADDILNQYCVRQFCPQCDGHHSLMEACCEGKPWHQESLECRAV